MSKYTIGIGLGIVFLIIIIGSYFLIKNNKDEPELKPLVSSMMSIEDPSFDFGEIDIFDGKVETTYTIKNTGEEEVSILSAATSCMCTEGEIDGFSFGMHEGFDTPIAVPVGESKIVKAIYDPLAHGPDGTGEIKRQLFLKTNSTKQPEIEMNFTANVTKKEK